MTKPRSSGTAPTLGEDTHRRTMRGAVLVIEDEAMVREVLSACFILLGCTVDSVDRVEGALALLNARRYDVIFVDRVMPGIGGSAGVAKIRTLLAGRRCLIIGMSGNASSKVVEDWKREGIDAFAEKPINLDRLRAILESSKSGNPIGDPAQGGHEPEPEAASVLDESVREEIEALGRRTGRELYLPMWREFVASLPGHQRQIEAALADADPGRIADTAHGLRGFARAIGAVELANACGAIEDEGPVACDSRRGELLASLRQAVARVRAVNLG